MRSLPTEVISPETAMDAINENDLESFMEEFAKDLDGDELDPHELLDANELDQIHQFVVNQQAKNEKTNAPTRSSEDNSDGIKPKRENPDTKEGSAVPADIDVKLGSDDKEMTTPIYDDAEPQISGENPVQMEPKSELLKTESRKKTDKPANSQKLAGAAQKSGKNNKNSKNSTKFKGPPKIHPTPKNQRPISGDASSDSGFASDQRPNGDRKQANKQNLPKNPKAADPSKPKPSLNLSSRCLQCDRVGPSATFYSTSKKYCSGKCSKEAKLLKQRRDEHKTHPLKIKDMNEKGPRTKMDDISVKRKRTPTKKATSMQKAVEMRKEGKPKGEEVNKKEKKTKLIEKIPSDEIGYLETYELPRIERPPTPKFGPIRPKRSEVNGLFVCLF